MLFTDFVVLVRKSVEELIADLEALTKTEEKRLRVSGKKTKRAEAYN